MRIPSALATLALLVPMAAFVGLAACRSAGTGTSAAPDPDINTRTREEARPAKPAPSPGVRAVGVGTDPGHVGRGTPLAARDGNALAAFAAGCFWGVEDTFRQVPGVVATAVGYTGGRTDDPTYEAVCSHGTAHAETLLVEFDPKVVTYETLLNVFFKNHNPTTMNRQGPDVGDQYRSAVFTFSPAQETAARAAKDREEGVRKKPVVTQVSPIGRFWKAEEYHQQYDEKTGTHSCPLPKGLGEGT